MAARGNYWEGIMQSDTRLVHNINNIAAAALMEIPLILIFTHSVKYLYILELWSFWKTTTFYQYFYVIKLAVGDEMNFSLFWFPAPKLYLCVNVKCWASICEIGPNPKIIFCRSELIFTPDLINKDVRLDIFREISTFPPLLAGVSGCGCCTSL